MDLSFFQETRVLWLVLHLVGFALGLGGATVADIFFFTFLRDGRISRHEVRLLGLLSTVIWFGLALLAVSGVPLLLAKYQVLSHSSRFITKLVVVLVIAMNGAVLNWYITPHLTTFARDKRLRRIAFASGAISFTSWYSALLLAMLKKLPFSLTEFLLIYALLLIGAVLGSQAIERFYKNRPTRGNRWYHQLWR